MFRLVTSFFSYLNWTVKLRYSSDGVDNSIWFEDVCDFDHRQCNNCFPLYASASSSQSVSVPVSTAAYVIVRWKLAMQAYLWPRSSTFRLLYNRFQRLLFNYSLNIHCSNSFAIAESPQAPSLNAPTSNDRRSSSSSYCSCSLAVVRRVRQISLFPSVPWQRWRRLDSDISSSQSTNLRHRRRRIRVAFKWNDADRTSWAVDDVTRCGRWSSPADRATSAV